MLLIVILVYPFVFLNFYMKILRSFIFLTFALLMEGLHGIMVIQMPGVNNGNALPSTVEIDFLEGNSTPLYTLKGEVQNSPFTVQSENHFMLRDAIGDPSKRYINKIRIKAAESGMILRLYDTENASVPLLHILMKAGFLMENNRPLEIDVLALGDDHQSIGPAEVSWYGRDLKALTKTNGMQIHKMDLHVSRDNDDSYLKPVLTFGMLSKTQPAPVNNILLPKNVGILPRNAVNMTPKNYVYAAPFDRPNLYAVQNPGLLV